MDRNRICRQLIEFQKATFDNSFYGLAKLQEQGEEMIDTFLDRSAWLPNEGRKAFTEWLEAYRKARSDFKRTVDENFERILEYFGYQGDESKEDDPKEIDRQENDQ
jgi:polyhydroxyalkanoate synthesis regulator phasin